MIIPLEKSFLSTESLISHKDKFMAFPTKSFFLPTNNYFPHKCIFTLFITELLFGLCVCVFVNFHFGGNGISTLI